MSSDDELPLSIEQKVDEVCTRFEAAWKAGTQPRVEDFLLELDNSTRPVALRELVALDIFYRRKLGDQPNAEEYRARFAELDTRAIAELLKDAAGDPAMGNSTINLSPTATHVSTFKPGQKVSYFGDYELVHEIAQGGMGIVYKARQVSLNRMVALKMIRAGVFATAAEVERFKQEAEAAATLDHPHIVPIFEVGEHEGQHYYTMKLIEGGSLAQVKDAWHLTPELDRSETRRRQDRIARLLITVARAVHHAHQRRLLHRDLKPANILIDAVGEPHVTDFGLAKKIEGDSALTQSGAIVGTASYMSPEQANGAKVITTQADVYGLGAVLYELLTGRPPFKGETPIDTLIEVRQREVVRPGKLAPRVDRDLETICLKCLEKEADLRYGSAEAMLADLERWQRGEPIAARRTSGLERTVKWVRRRPVLASLAASVGVGCLVYLASMISFTVIIIGKQNEIEIVQKNLREEQQETKVASDREKKANIEAKAALVQEELALRARTRAFELATAAMAREVGGTIRADNMANYSGIRYVDVAFKQVTDEMLNELHGLESLEFLNLSFTMVTDDGLKKLAALDRLHALYLYRTNITDNGLRSLATLKHLRELNIGGTKISDVGLKELRVLLKLQVLILVDTEISDAGLRELADAHRLRVLRLGNCKITNTGASELTRMLDLVSLDLDRTAISDEGIRQLSKLQHLAALSLEGVDATDNSTTELAKISTLVHLRLSHTKLTDEGLRRLGKLDKLKSLCLARVNITDVGVKHLAALRDLQELDLNDTALSDASVMDLGRFTKLKDLHLTGTKISPAGARDLQRLLPKCQIHFLVIADVPLVPHNPPFERGF